MNIEKELLDDPAFQLMSLTIMAVDILEKIQTLSSEGVIEVMMFNRYVIHRRLPFPGLRKKTSLVDFNRLISPFENDTLGNKFMSTFLTHINNSQSDEIASKVVNLLLRRGDFYEEEFTSIQNEEGWIPTRLYTLFYLNPLSNETSIIPEVDYPQVMAFSVPLVNMIKFVNQGTDLVLNNIQD